MKWEYIGRQELSVSNRSRLQNYKAHPDMWRASVPGGWMVVLSNSIDIKNAFFYPDPEHVWEIEAEDTDGAASILLRPAEEQRRLSDK